MKFRIYSMLFYETRGDKISVCIHLCLYLFLLSSNINTYLKCLNCPIIFFILYALIVIVWTIFIFNWYLHSHSSLI